jgi:hypothetical protein
MASFISAITFVSKFILIKQVLSIMLVITKNNISVEIESSTINNYFEDFVSTLIDPLYNYSIYLIFIIFNYMIVCINKINVKENIFNDIINVDKNVNRFNKVRILGDVAIIGSKTNVYNFKKLNLSKQYLIEGINSLKVSLNIQIEPHDFNNKILEIKKIIEEKLLEFNKIITDKVTLLVQLDNLPLSERTDSKLKKLQNASKKVNYPTIKFEIKNDFFEDSSEHIPN